MTMRTDFIVAMATALLSCNSVEKDCDTVYGAIKSGILEHGKLPKDAEDRDRLAKALEGALSSWKTARASVKNDEVRKLGDAKAEVLEARVKLLREVRFDAPSAKAKSAPVAGAAGSSGSAAASAKPMTRKQALEAAAETAVGKMLGPSIPAASHDALTKNYDAAGKANDALSSWCIDNGG
jgi:hypothetical protein